jgi:hypothetical protein
MTKTSLYILVYLFSTFMIPVTIQAKDLPEFMIFTYNIDLTEKNVKTLADADFNIVYGPADKLDLCKKYGLKLMIPRPGLETAARLKGDPGVWGYDIRDEPLTLKDTYATADSVKAYRAADPTHMTFVNLFGKAGHWVKFSIDTVQPDFLSYDHYLWWFGGINRWFTGEDGYYVKLEQFREEAILAGLPLTIWNEVNVQYQASDSKDNELRDRNWITPPNNDKKIRLLTYVSLAYGAKGILWFYGPCLFDKTGDMNETGRQVTVINHELKNLGPVLLPLNSAGVFHTPPFTRGSRQTTPDYWVQPLGKNLLMGTFRDKEKKEYVMVVNKDWKSSRKATLQFQLWQQVVNSVEMLDKHTGEWKTLPMTEVKDTRNHKKIYNFDNIPPAIKEYISVSNLTKGKRLTPEMLSFWEKTFTYPPPYQVVSFTLAPGDGELVRVTFKDGEDFSVPPPKL